MQLILGPCGQHTPQQSKIRFAIVRAGQNGSDQLIRREHLAVHSHHCAKVILVQAGVRLLDCILANRLFAQRVDSLSVSLHDAADHTVEFDFLCRKKASQQS